MMRHNIILLDKEVGKDKSRLRQLSANKERLLQLECSSPVKSDSSSSYLKPNPRVPFRKLREEHADQSCKNKMVRMVQTHEIFRRLENTRDGICRYTQCT